MLLVPNFPGPAIIHHTNPRASGGCAARRHAAHERRRVHVDDAVSQSGGKLSAKPRLDAVVAKVKAMLQEPPRSASDAPTARLCRLQYLDDSLRQGVKQRKALGVITTSPPSVRTDTMLV